MANNDSLHQARVAQQDEFYTQLSDIEAELQHYTKYFAGKTVICNCDNWKWSNFVRYFKEHFFDLQLKRLIACNYKPLRRDSLFEKGEDESAKDAWHYEYDGANETAEVLRGDGDFRSKESIELLKEADIVVTNPPFSLFREYVAQLMEYKKKFLIIGNQNAIAYKDIFPLIKENKVWLGVTMHSGGSEFRIPNSLETYSDSLRIDEYGNKHLKLSFTRWFTNLEYNRKHEPMELSIKYDQKRFTKYDNYDAINVDRTCDIPYDYEGVIGVPITFLDKYCPEQFEIVGLGRTDLGVSIGVGVNYTEEQIKSFRKENAGFRRGTLCYRDKDGKLQVAYTRILIKHKHPQKD